jgi:hypothetical protein
MDNLSLKPKKTEEPKQKRKWVINSVYALLLLNIVICFLLFFIWTIKDRKLAKDNTQHVVKIDTVYIPGKVVESNFEACYDVSDVNTIHVTVKNGVVNVESGDCD